MSPISLLLLCVFFLPPSSAQQSYPSQFLTLDCSNNHPENAGYLCDSTIPNCSTLAYYRVQSGSFSTIDALATTLFGTNASAVAQASSLASKSDQLSVGQGLYIPIQCSCSGNYSAENIAYTIEQGDSFVKLANLTYEGLSTCQAMQAANPTAVPAALALGQRVVLPLRCACPSQQQRSKGIKMLVTYPIAGGDTISTISSMFGVPLQDLFSANSLNSSTASLFPATTVLVPFNVTPNVPPNSTSNAPPPSGMPGSSSASSSHSKTGIYIGVAIAAAVLLLIAAAGCFVIKKKRRASKDQLLPPIASPRQVVPPVKSAERPVKNFKVQQDPFVGTLSFPGSEKLKTYTLDELKQATQDFSPSTQIRGAVYRGVIKGQVVAVKNMTRNVTKELQILQKVHHTNLVTLLGLCISSPDQSYLVYEYAENGSLSDWLHDSDFSMGPGSSSTLTWNNRLRVASGVATALEYIHNHAYPSFVHKDIKSSNILLDSKFRGKVANFGLAKSTEDMEQGSALTRHIVGTQGYLSPEYLNHGMVSPKMDVFAFGVVLLEILSGEEAVMRDRAGCFLWEAIDSVLEGDDAKEKLKDWMDARLQNAFPLDCAYSVAELAKSCVDEDPGARPDMRKVGYTLAKLLQMSLEWEPSAVLEENYTDNPLDAR